MFPRFIHVVARISVSYMLAFNAVSLTNVPEKTLFWILLAPDGLWQTNTLGQPSPYLELTSPYPFLATADLGSFFRNKKLRFM